MTVVVPLVILSAILGGTIDLRNHHKTRYILRGENQTPVSTSINHFESSYRVIESSRDVCELFDVDPRLALIIKLDHFSNDLANHIRSSVISRDTIVEIQIRAVYKMLIESLPDNFKPDAEWNERKNIGTHFISKLRRGGEMAASITFNCKSIDHKDKVLKSILKNFEKSGAFDSSFIEKLDMVKKELGKDYPNYNVKTVQCPLCYPEHRQSTVLKDLVKIAENLTESVKYLSEKGNVIEMELEDLSTKLNVPSYKENEEIISKLDEIEKMFDDVLIAREQFIQWDSVWSLDLTAEEEKEINDFHVAVEKARREFLHSIGHLDISSSASDRQFDSVYEAYGSTKGNNRFQRLFRELREKYEHKDEY